MAKVNNRAIELAKKFLEKLKSEGVNIERLYLYGSYAKGAEHKWSDIDIAVVSSDFKGSRFDEGVKLKSIASNIDIDIEPVPFRPDTFIDEDPLVWEIKKEGIRIA